MEISLTTIIIIIVALFAIPFFSGNAINVLLKRENTICDNFVFGYITLWALCLVLAVPMVLLKLKLTTLIIVFLGCVIALVMFGLINVKKINIAIQINNKLEMVFFIIMIVMCLFVLIMQTMLQHTDADDSRFVVNAVDTYFSNRLLLTDVITGQKLERWSGELVKDVVAPWAVYVAMMAKIIGIHPTIFMHTILPIVLLILVFNVYWLLSKEFFETNKIYRIIFVCIVTLIDIFGCFSVFCKETFMLTRIWQGKAVLASIGIPLLMIALFQIYEEQNKERYYTILIINLGMLLTSSMTIIICPVMVGCYAIVYCIIKKRLKMMFGLMAVCIPNIMLFVVSQVVDKI